MSDHPRLAPAVAAVRALFDAAACSVALVDRDGGHLVYVAADGVGSAEIVGVELPVSRGVAGWTVMSGQPMAVRDVASDPRFARDVAESTHYVPATLFTAPLFDDDGDAAGVLSVLDPGVDVASDWALAVLGTLAAMIGGLVGAPDLGRDHDRLASLGRRVLQAVEEFEP